MFANILSWFSKEATPNSTSDATTSIESHQLTSPEAPSINRMVTEQPPNQTDTPLVAPVFSASSAVSAVSIAASFEHAVGFPLDFLDALLYT
ncbi:hypothetical protein N7530_005212 [Penicillium desertorum]|uniref:Uncharacterized protein n=1 Tax=Penicillium desertorum TaxID=1303715 RepID=A0A9W9WZL7_9EURO|nr:hypothetical protein N7530_005212 [Penicillium desertorum]